MGQSGLRTLPWQPLTNAPCNTSLPPVQHALNVVCVSMNKGSGITGGGLDIVCVPGEGGVMHLHLMW